MGDWAQQQPGNSTQLEFGAHGPISFEGTVYSVQLACLYRETNAVCGSRCFGTLATKLNETEVKQMIQKERLGSALKQIKKI